MTELLYDKIVDKIAEKEYNQAKTPFTIKLRPEAYKILRTEGVKYPQYENKFNQIVEYDSKGKMWILGCKIEITDKIKSDFIVCGDSLT